jgi:hypothetical protein
LTADCPWADDGRVNSLEQVLASFPLTIWLVLVEVALFRTAVAALFAVSGGGSTQSEVAG